MEEKREHGGNLWKASRRFGMPPDQFLDFSANINPLGPPPRVLQSLADHLGLIARYPQPGAEELKGALSKYLDIPVESILLGNGGIELIYLLGGFFHSSRVVIPVPAFGEYGAGHPGSRRKEVPLDQARDFHLEVGRLAQTLEKGDLVFVGNPNNPTGVLTRREDLLSLYRFVIRQQGILVIDEAFMDFAAGSQSLVREGSQKPGLIITGSLTKFFALPGLRLGYLVTTPTLVKKLKRLLPPWRINGLAQLAGLVALKDRDYQDRTLSLIREERNFLIQGLDALGFRTFPSAANFLLVDGRPVQLSAGRLEEYLGVRGILIRNCRSFSNLDEFFFRIGVRTRAENERLLGALAFAIKDLCKQSKEKEENRCD
jgi:threonine-phosphate decarboxylase